MSSTENRICVRCVMDESDPEITFDEQGVCSHCRNFDSSMASTLALADSGQRKQELGEIFDRIKRKRRNKKYDVIIGLSGGVDSSYVALLAKEFGLRALAVHFDSGWNSELAVHNVESIVKKLGFDLYTEVADWEEMKDLQRAFFKASVANCDIPQDHAFLAALYRVAARTGIPYTLSGYNIATESVLPKAWGYNAGDARHVKAIHKQFGERPLKRYPFLGFWKRYLWFPFFKGFRVIAPLNYVPFVKAEAKERISRELGWRDYGGKHHESIFTRFFQGYYLPQKFGYDKRKAHLSSLILAGQATREEALEELSKPPYPVEDQKRDLEYVSKKIGMSVSEFEDILALPKKSFKDYPNNAHLFRMKDWLVSQRNRILRRG